MERNYLLLSIGFECTEVSESMHFLNKRRGYDIC